MKFVFGFLLLLLAALANSVDKTPTSPLSGTWDLHVLALDNSELATAKIRFTEISAKSCISGEWQQVAVISHKGSFRDVFPLSQNLSYMFNGNELTIGRNEICDAYLHLSTEFDSEVMRGDIVSFGIEHNERTGKFVLRRASGRDS